MNDYRVNVFAAFSESVALNGRRVAIEMENDSFTYDEILLGALRIAGHLGALRSDGEERVGLLAANGIPFIAGFYGAMGADLEVIPLNCLLAPAELAGQIRHSGTRTLLVSGMLEPLARAAAGLVDENLRIVLLERVLTETEPVPVHPDDLHKTGDETAIILYTSGTTGEPKGVMLSHRNLVSNCRAFTHVLNFSDRDTCVCVLPFFHTFALTVYCLGALYNGARILLLPRFQPRQTLAALRSVASGIFTAVPPQFSLLARTAGPGAEPLTNLRIAVSGGAALLPEIQKEFEAAFGIKVLQGYGLTETSPVVSCNRPDNNRDGSVGLPLDGIEVRVMGEDGAILPPGEVGELLIRGDNVMKGYYRNPEATREVLDGEWLRTGDLASVDADGFIRIAGRKKELIISAGENIYPAEVENVLLSHDAVAEAAVIGIPHPLKGETPKAFVVLREGREAAATELRRHCLDHLASFKAPADFEFLAELPKSAAGKILKHRLRSARVEA